jgi:hypothetical protein
MSGKILLTIWLAWLGAVVLWLRSAQSFSFGIMLGHGKGAKLMAYILAYSIQLLIFGWIIPLALGVYRLIRNHRSSN